VESAWGAIRKKDGYMKRKYLSLVSRCGKKKAIVATGHKIIIAAYHILKDKEAYQEPELHTSEKQKTKQINRLIARLNEFGLDVLIHEIRPVME
jgi:hypothetical protein